MILDERIDVVERQGEESVSGFLSKKKQNEKKEKIEVGFFSCTLRAGCCCFFYVDVDNRTSLCFGSRRKKGKVD